MFVMAITTFHPGMVSVKEAVSHNENPDRDCFLPKETGKMFWKTVASMTTGAFPSRGAPRLSRKSFRKVKLSRFDTYLHLHTAVGANMAAAM